MPVLWLACSVALVACGAKEETAQATQVAAKVGDSEISIHQINQVLSRTPMNAASKDEVQAASSQVLERLIDQQLAVDQAMQKKLHRSPEIVAQLEAARRDVLARAYLQQVVAGMPKPTADEVRKYYEDNPALFSERRIYNLQEVRIPRADAALLADLRRLADQGRSLDDTVALLRSRSVAFTGSSAPRAAEQIPLDLLPRLHALKDGQSLVLPAGEGALVVRVAASRPAPVTEAAAAPGIQQFLANRRAGEVVADEIKRLRAATTVTYMGDFQRAAATKRDATSAPTSVVGPAASASDVDPGKPAGSMEQALIERGLQGLK